MGEYQRKADRMDALLGDGGGGRVRRQLDLFGDLITIVVGKYNELSEGGHMLLDAMASSRAAMVERRTGMASHEAKMEKGVIQGELRRQLSVVNLRASMACMLDRLHQCGEGGRLRNRRQEWRVREEERMREEREMQWATRMIGRSLLQPGRILTNQVREILCNNRSSIVLKCNLFCFVVLFLFKNKCVFCEESTDIKSEGEKPGDVYELF